MKSKALAFSVLFHFVGFSAFGSNLSGQDAISLLKSGNSRFANHAQSRPDNTTKLQERRPHTIVVSCSEPDISPEVAFDQGLGQIYSIRTLGNTLTSDSISNIEYAIDKFDTRLILILGHESCGAVKSALEAFDSSPDRRITSIQDGITKFKGSEVKDPLIRPAVKAHVYATARSLVKHSLLIRDRINDNQLMIVQGLYTTAGTVEFSEDVGKLYVSILNSEPGSRKLAAKPTHKVHRKNSKKPRIEQTSSEENPWRAKKSLTSKETPQ